MNDHIWKILQAIKSQKEHEHCFHIFRGPIWMVIPDGHVIEKCCMCDATRTVHAEHRADDHVRGVPWGRSRRKCELRVR